MSDPFGPTAYYIATVWMANADDDDWSATRTIVRLLAIGPDDFQARVRSNWPNKSLTFGPISRSKVQS